MRERMDDHRYRQLVRATASLQDWFAPLVFSDLSRAAVSGIVRERAVAWATSHGFDVRRGVEAVATKLRGHNRHIGLLDIACTHPSGQQLAIEVDYSNRVWSIEKLAAEADAGKLALWVKWGAPASLSLIPEKVGVVELRVDWTNQSGHMMFSRQRNTTSITDERDVATAPATRIAT